MFLLAQRFVCLLFFFGFSKSPGKKVFFFAKANFFFGIWKNDLSSKKHSSYLWSLIQTPNSWTIVFWIWSRWRYVASRVNGGLHFIRLKSAMWGHQMFVCNLTSQSLTFICIFSDHNLWFISVWRHIFGDIASDKPSSLSVKWSIQFWL